MKKTIYTFMVSMALLPMSMMAQQATEKEKFKAQFMLQVKENAKAEVSAELAVLNRKHKLDAESYKTLYQVFYNRKVETEKALLEGDKSPESQKKIIALISKHDSISNYYLSALRDKNLQGDKVLDANDHSKFASAIRLKKQLNLSSKQIDSLLYQSKLMAQLKSDNPSLDLKAYERKMLPNILEDQQYTDLLISLNRKTASQWAHNSWNTLKDRGIDGGLDSTQVIRDLFNYNLSKLVKKDRFGNDIPKGSNSLSKMLDRKPEALQRLQSDEARNVADKPAETKTSFAW